MKIGEAYYKLEKSEQAVEYFRKAEALILPKKDYLISMFIAKSLDKLKQWD